MSATRYCHICLEEKYPVISLSATMTTLATCPSCQAPLLDATMTAASAPQQPSIVDVVPGRILPLRLGAKSTNAPIGDVDVVDLAQRQLASIEAQLSEMSVLRQRAKELRRMIAAAKRQPEAAE